jgi:rhamnose utilization protein RhaD (predicted bifunctional aldolase and dehydrogenase)
MGLRQFVEFCHLVGAHPDLVQSGGGNISIKLSDDEMLIKASGMDLSEVSETQNYVHLKYQGPTQFHLKTPSGFRPSMETGFHISLKQKFVLHTHSVWANILTCSEEGENLVKKLFPMAVWIPYTSPGKELGDLIELKKGEHQLFFLQSHGLISTGQTWEECWQLHCDVREKVKEYFILSDYEDFSTDSVDAGVLFPDQVVYRSVDNQQNEVMRAFSFILHGIINNKLSPRFLGQLEIEFLEKMEEEKFRRNLKRI